MDTIRIEAGRFAYQTPMDKASTLILVFPNFSQHPVFAEPGASVDIKADASHLKEMTVKGTDENKLMTSFREQIVSASPDEEVSAAERFINDHPDSRVSLYLFQKYFSMVPTVDFPKTFRLLSVMEDQKKSDIPAVELTRQRQYLNGKKATTTGSVLPSFSVLDMEGNNISSNSYKNGVAVLSTWATWSYVSLDIQRAIRDIRHDHPELHVLAICLDGSKVECDRSVKGQSLEGTFVCDEQMTEGKLYRLLGFSTVPDNIILQNGRIVARGLDNKQLKRLITYLNKLE